MKQTRVVYQTEYDKERVVRAFSRNIIIREYVLASILGAVTVMMLGFMSTTFWSVLGIIIIYLGYYIYTYRDGKLSELEGGYIYYLTDELKRQGISIERYYREPIINVVYTFGVSSLIAMEGVGVAYLFVEDPIWVVIALLLYLTVMCVLGYRYVNKVSAKVLEVVDTHNVGLLLTLIPEERERMYREYGISCHEEEVISEVCSELEGVCERDLQEEHDLQEEASLKVIPRELFHFKGDEELEEAKQVGLDEAKQPKVAYGRLTPYDIEQLRRDPNYIIPERSEDVEYVRELEDSVSKNKRSE